MSGPGVAKQRNTARKEGLIYIWVATRRHCGHEVEVSSYEARAVPEPEWMPVSIRQAPSVRHRAVADTVRWAGSRVYSDAWRMPMLRYRTLVCSECVEIYAFARGDWPAIQRTHGEGVGADGAEDDVIARAN